MGEWILIRFLQEHTALRIVRREGWFYAVKHAVGETEGEIETVKESETANAAGPIAFRADMDALCGLTLRAGEEAAMKELEEKILAFARQEADHAGLGMEYKIADYFPETRNHDDALTRVLACADRLQIPAIRMKSMWRASEDFGWYLKACRGAIFYIGNGETYPPVHTAVYDFNDKILPNAVRMFAALAGLSDNSV